MLLEKRKKELERIDAEIKELRKKRKAIYNYIYITENRKKAI
jgi:hypothetical protein